VAANGNSSNPNEGGIATNGSGGTGTVQIGYQTDTWGLAALYSSIQNGNDIIVYGTTFALESFTNKGTTSAFALSGYWQPEESGWIPSISAGWGINSTSYNGSVYNDPSGIPAAWAPPANPGAWASTGATSLSEATTPAWLLANRCSQLRWNPGTHHGMAMMCGSGGISSR
jgi:hypothetical protein